MLKRTHGGALSIRAPAERDLKTRFVQNVEAKRAIGRICCDLMEEGEAICTPRDIDIIVTDSASEDLSRICREHEIKLEEAGR